MGVASLQKIQKTCSLLVQLRAHKKTPPGYMRKKCQNRPPLPQSIEDSLIHKSQRGNPVTKESAEIEKKNEKKENRKRNSSEKKDKE